MDLPSLTDALKIVTPIIAPAIKVITEKVIEPLVRRSFESSQLRASLTPENIEARFSEYILRYYAKLYFINTLVFGGRRVKLLDIYQPLTIESCKRGDKAVFTIDRWHGEFLPVTKRVLLVDTAGMGKSTIIKWLFLSIIDKCDTIPIYVELRSVGKAKSILDYIAGELGEYESPFPRDLLIALLGSGKFAFFFDGFDEIDREKKKEVTDDIQDFIARNPDNLYLMASRREAELNCFGDFEEFRIRGLKKAEAYALIRRYDVEGTCAEILISDLEKGAYKQVADLLAVPMLVSLIFKAYSYKPKIPIRKSIFYRQVFDALYEAHDFTKGGCFSRKKFSGLDIDDFHKALRFLGYASMRQGRVEYSRDEIVALLVDISERLPDMRFQPSDLLRDLLETVPLFRQDGLMYVWSHKSVQDYFAAQYICYDAQGRQESIIVSMCGSGGPERYQNILDMVCDADSQVFRLTAVYFMLGKFLEFAESYLRSGLVNGDLEYRCAVCFWSQAVAVAVLKTSESSDVRSANAGAPEDFKKMDRLIREAMSVPKKEFMSGTLHGARGQLRVGWQGNPLKNYFVFSIMKARGFDVFLDRKGIARREDAVAAFREKIPPDTACIVDLNPENIINSVELFDHLSLLLESRAVQREAPLLSIGKARVLYDVIVTERQRASVADENF